MTFWFSAKFSNLHAAQPGAQTLHLSDVLQRVFLLSVQPCKGKTHLSIQRGTAVRKEEGDSSNPLFYCQEVSARFVQNQLPVGLCRWGRGQFWTRLVTGNRRGSALGAAKGLRTFGNVHGTNKITKTMATCLSLPAPLTHPPRKSIK